MNTVLSALYRAQDIRYRFGGEDFIALDDFPPPRPWFLYQKTHDAPLKRLEVYEKKSGSRD